MSLNAKARLKQILSGSEPGNPFKLDRPDAFPDEDQLRIPSNFWARGMLVEVYTYKSVYKPKGHKHYPNAKAFDSKMSGQWVQIKSAGNPNTPHQIPRMIKAIDDLVNAAGPEDKLILHIISRDVAESEIRVALLAHKFNTGLTSRLDIVFEQYIHP
jgi:hypothetical protein